MNHVSLKVALLFCIAMLIPLAQAEAVNMGKMVVSAPKQNANKGYAIGIILSKSCIILVKVNSTKCPSYERLVPMYDNSIPEYSGSFQMKDGFYQRVPPTYQGSMGYYQYDPIFRIFVDPIKRTEMPTITIETKLPEYHIAGQFKVNEVKDYSLKDSKALKSIRSYSHTRYMDDDCTHGIITAENWQELLPDTITYMRNNCDPKSTKIDTITLEIKPLVKHDIATSAKYKHEKFYDTVIKNCTKSYQSCKKIENRAITTFSDTK